MMFFGEYEHSIDDKSRLRVPAKLRDALGREAAYLTFGVNGCLNIMPESAMGELMDKLSSLSLTETEETKGMRRFAASITPIEEDNQGRFVLQARLREFAQIKKNVVFVGVGKKIELWSKENWLAYMQTDGPSAFDADFNKLKERGI